MKPTIDGGAANAVDDTNPTEVGGGYYFFNITAAESNGDSLAICPASTTANVQVVGCPAALYTSGLAKNTADQLWVVFAFDETDNTPVIGDAANITANLRIDGGDANAIDDLAPTELERGYYFFNITADETNGDSLVIYPSSTTANVQVVGCPAALYTSAAPSAPTLSCAAGTASVTATIDGDAGVTNYLVYKKPADTDWTAGGNRSGDGDITVSSLENDIPYVFVAYSKSAEGAYSVPSAPVQVTLSASVENDFDSELIDTAADFLTMFAESITYIPRGGDQRQITGIIDREGAAGLPGAPAGNAPLCMITVANDSSSGISSSEIDKGGDKIKYSLRKGETAQERKIVKIISQDAGMMTLEVR